MLFDFDYEELADDSGDPVFRVRIFESGLPPHILGVVRKSTKARFPHTPLRWTAALSVEPDPSKWDKKAVRSGFDERDLAAFWLLGVSDAFTTKYQDAAKAVREESWDRYIAPEMCPACAKLVISNYNTHPQIKNAAMPGRYRDELRCQNCNVEVFRLRDKMPRGYRQPWQLVQQP